MELFSALLRKILVRVIYSNSMTLTSSMNIILKGSLKFIEITPQWITRQEKFHKILKFKLY